MKYVNLNETRSLAYILLVLFLMVSAASVILGMTVFAGTQLMAVFGILFLFFLFMAIMMSFINEI